MQLFKQEEVLDFWFKELTPTDWFAGGNELDNLIKERFLVYLEACYKGELFSWRETPRGRLAEIIILDQFSRNIHRGTPLAFSNDALALALAQEMVFHNFDKQLSLEERSFSYMPYMHSESSLIHKEAMKLFSIPGLEENLKFEFEHMNIIDRFGRYPHRNIILGRTSTPDELEFMKVHQGF